MSPTPSPERSTQSSLNPEPAILQQFVFVKQSDNVNSSKTRRAVRSHAMRAVRRQQRQENAKVIRVKWPGEHTTREQLQAMIHDEQVPEDEERQSISPPEGRTQSGSQEGDVFGGTPLPEWSESPTSVKNHSLSLTKVHGSRNLHFEELKSPSSMRRQDPSPYTNVEADEEVAGNSVSARSFLGSGRVDPFQTFPIHSDRSVQQLADHCTPPW